MDISNENHVLRYVTREANDMDRETFLIVGGRNGTDRLLHRCVIEDHALTDQVMSVVLDRRVRFDR